MLIIIWICGFLLSASAIFLVFSGNWPAVLWNVCAGYLFVQLIKMDMVLECNNKWMQKSKKINTKLTNRLIVEQGKNEAMLANCKRYQEQLKQLRKNERTSYVKPA